MITTCIVVLACCLVVVGIECIGTFASYAATKHIKAAINK